MSKLTEQERIAFLAGWNARETGNAHVAGGQETALSMFERAFDFGDEEVGEVLLRPRPPQTPLSDGWQDIASAPRDGTPILVWCVHRNARYAGDPKDWAAPVVTQWIDLNGGGWTWYGMVGEFTHWRPLPAPPLTNDKGAGA